MIYPIVEIEWWRDGSHYLVDKGLTMRVLCRSVGYLMAEEPRLKVLASGIDGTGKPTMVTTIPEEFIISITRLT